ncbi:TIGR02757 family protein, partial [Bacteroidota bacterium]
MKKSRIISLKRKLNYYYRSFSLDQISPDPLEFLHRYENKNDIEIAGFISSVFAYGNVTMILNSIEKVIEIMEDKPYDFVMNYSLKDGNKLFDDVRHRFFTPGDIAILFQVLQEVYTKCRSLKYFFLLYYFENSPNLKEAISSFSNNLLGIASHYGEITNGLKFMFPDPKKGSACKRMNLFLRWMVRKDELDLGLWPEVPASKLIIP